ncbi:MULTISPECIES: dihydrofolate reductase family protein [unclassified Pseudonocardia]|uniref:dihydrofolate reductase family protein n=1 Tax=unclassified Pseudonocardia TaxID=2619320 RepID=UPI0001FFEBD9|nr:dihydrofolate reductase family protein [Pseudonocardia sp. Ae707_Ps1]OLM19738.1 Dihydrofolate reductase [Pseudonocardia sp. Ae707_Ps1]
MRTLAITQNITLDGAVEMLGSWFDPTADAGDQQAEMHRQDASCDAVLLGRRTFTDFRGFWPEQTDDTTGVTAYLDKVQKYVVSSTLTDPEWVNSTILAGDPVAEVTALKEASGQDIVVTGSIDLCHTLIAAGLVDELRLFHYPVVQGRGRGLFPDGWSREGLRLIDAKSFSGGVTYTCHSLR